MAEVDEITEKLEKLRETIGESFGCSHTLIDEKIKSDEFYRERMNSYCEKTLQHCIPDIIEYLKRCSS